MKTWKSDSKRNTPWEQESTKKPFFTEDNIEMIGLSILMVVLLAMLLLARFPASPFYIEPSANSSHTDTEIVSAVVIDKQLIKPRNWNLRYYVIISYGDVTQDFDSSSLYGRYNVGDTIDMELISHYNSEGNLSYQYLRIPH